MVIILGQHFLSHDTRPRLFDSSLLTFSVLKTVAFLTAAGLRPRSSGRGRKRGLFVETSTLSCPERLRGATAADGTARPGRCCCGGGCTLHQRGPFWTGRTLHFLPAAAALAQAGSRFLQPDSEKRPFGPSPPPPPPEPNRNMRRLGCAGRRWMCFFYCTGGETCSIIIGGRLGRCEQLLASVCRVLC